MAKTMSREFKSVKEIFNTYFPSHKIVGKIVDESTSRNEPNGESVAEKLLAELQQKYRKSSVA